MKKPPKLTVVGTDANGTSPRRKPPPRGAKLRQSILCEYDIDDAGGQALLTQVCAAIDRLDEVTWYIEQAGGAMVKGQRAQRSIHC